MISTGRVMFCSRFQLAVLLLICVSALLLMRDKKIPMRKGEKESIILSQDDLHILLFETHVKSDDMVEHFKMSPLDFLLQKSQLVGIKASIFGRGEYRGWGEKFIQLRLALPLLSPQTLVIVADSRDVILNLPNKPAYGKEAVDEFHKIFKKLTAGSPHGAVVVSAEAQCCVSAMSHARPEDYFDRTGHHRLNRACDSGADDCVSEDNANTEEWKRFMENLALEKTAGDRSIDSVYLNAGLLAGYPQDLLKLLDRIQLDVTEDDQAVMSGLMYYDSSFVILDYKQELFGNNKWTEGHENGCIFRSKSPNGMLLMHPETKSTPLLVHTSGKFYTCFDELIEAIDGGGGIQMVTHIDFDEEDESHDEKGNESDNENVERALGKEKKKKKKKKKNYGKL